MAEIIDAITLDAIREAKPERMWWSVATCWWTHDGRHLCQAEAAGLPCDPRGGMLMQTDDVEGFLKNAENNPSHYGEYALASFVGAHHLNCIVGDQNPRPTCLETWAEYTAILSAQAGMPLPVPDYLREYNERRSR